MPLTVVAPRSLIEQLETVAAGRAACLSAEALPDARWAEVEADLGRGGSIAVIGVRALPRMRHLWVDVQPCGARGLRASEPGALPLRSVGWRPAACRGLGVRPPGVETYFGVDEMPRANVTPLVEAVDETGAPCAYPAVWLRHYAASLVGRRHAGSNWYLFAFEDPLEAASAAEWSAVVSALCDHAGAPIGFTRTRAHYASYRPGERVSIQIGVANWSEHITAARIECTLAAPDGSTASTQMVRRCLDSREEVTPTWEFVCGEQPGLWRVRATLHLEDRFTYGQARETGSAAVEGTECGYVVAPADASALAAPRIHGRSLAVGEHDGMLAGTHYYPSSSWWDWAWRDFRPELAARDIAEMERHGYRLARVWIDPEQDEASLRGFEAWLLLSGARGIVSSVCVFTQWARRLTYEENGATQAFDFAGHADYNVYSVQLTNVERQRAYLAALARRWAQLPNVMWNLSNETFIVDPDPSQVDPAYFGDVTPKQGPLAGAAYFGRWADLMTETLRENGAHQPVVRGYGFPNGGDCYLYNRDGSVLVWHHYASVEFAGPSLALAAPGTLAKPLVMEEFGIPTFDEDARLERYEGVACWSAAMGASAACAYEWGVSWLAPELPYTATPLKDSSLVANPDPRWMEGSVVYAASWPVGSMGLCPWSASFAYGSNQPCTPFASPAARALGAVARFCADIGPPHGAEAVALVVPMEWQPFAPLRGYQRELDPTVAAVLALAAAHVPFTVVHEDQLGDMDAAPAVAVVPAVQPLCEATRAELDRMARAGTVVACGNAEEWLDAVAPHAIDVRSDAPVSCVRRWTRSGALYLLYAPDGPARVRLAEGGADVELDVRRYALVEALASGGSRTWVGQAGRPPDVS